jgi:general secretion pathway protein N
MLGLPFFKRRPTWVQGAGALTTRWLESTLEVARWENMRKAGRRWGWWGAGVGALLGLIVYAPASWLAQAVFSASGGRVLLAESQGTVWHGDAVAVLMGGAGSRDARSLPGRLNWTMRLRPQGLLLTFQQGCCLPSPVTIRIQPGWARVRAELGVPAGGQLGHWPAAWLSGLGTPWNTLQLGGVLRVESQGLAVEWVQGRLRMEGSAGVVLDNVCSRVTTLDRVGSYRLDLQADPQGQMRMTLGTLDGALQLIGEGGLSASGLRFRGEASVREAERGALDNLLNIIGRRVGDRSVISIG